ncbi:aspartate/glutamate racemase family protein [bacterium]|nr:aspartate/glutamate racemase family protein [bacterium]
MFYYGKDPGITSIKARKGKLAYGMGLGIMILDEVYPAFPGDLRNPSAYPYPIQYSVVKGIDCEILIRAEDKSPCRKPILEAAKELEKMGCRAILSECGYFAYFQKEVKEQVNIPVFMSSLIQFSWIQQSISSQKSIGILCAEKKYLKEDHLKAVDIDLNSNFVIAGARDEYVCTQFESLWNHDLGPAVGNYETNEKELVEIAMNFVSKNPTMGALLLECTSMTPFARAIQRAVDLPVYSWGTLLDYAYSISVARDYYGHV